MDVKLSAGTIEYEDTGGRGPVVVLLHGLAMDGTVWRHVVANLRSDYRCVVPTLPIGSHRRAMRPGTDLSLRGHARILAEFLDRLGLGEVTLVQNDIAVGMVLAGEQPERAARLVLASVEAFDNYPPGLPGKILSLAAKVPGGLNALFQPMRLRALRRPSPFGMMSIRPIPHEITDGWFRPLLTQPEIRRDLLAYIRSVDQRVMIEATERMRAFDRPALVVWAKQDRLMPLDHGRRLAELLPYGRLVEIDDSRTLIPEDQPGRLAQAIRAFMANQ